MVAVRRFNKEANKGLITDKIYEIGDVRYKSFFINTLN